MNPNNQSSESHVRGQRGARGWFQSGSKIRSVDEGLYYQIQSRGLRDGTPVDARTESMLGHQGWKQQETGRKKEPSKVRTQPKRRGLPRVPAGSASQPRAFRTAQWNSLWGDSPGSAGLSWPDARPDSVPRLGITEGGGVAVGRGSSWATGVCAPSGVEADSSTCAKCNTTVSLLTCSGRCWAAGLMCSSFTVN